MLAGLQVVGQFWVVSLLCTLLWRFTLKSKQQNDQIVRSHRCRRWAWLRAEVGVDAGVGWCLLLRWAGMQWVGGANVSY